jgi:hypothetical protein
MERFRLLEYAAYDVKLPMPGGVCQIDRLSSIETKCEQTRILKNPFESVAEFRVAHSFSSSEIDKVARAYM